MMTNQPAGAAIHGGDSPESAVAIGREGRSATILLAAERSNGQCAAILSTECPGREPPRHRHQHEDETCYVLAGTLTYHVGDDVLQASAGSCVFLPRGIDHAFVVHSPEVRLLTFYTPAGFEGYVREMSGPTSGGPTYELERMIAVAARYGCEITGPPPGETTRESTHSRHAGDRV